MIARSGDLWRLLAAITINKLRKQVERHTADKRSPAHEQSFAGESSLRGIRAEAVAGDLNSL